MNFPSIDIMITDFCNQNCSFCFARKEMRSPLKREMSLSDFKLIIKKCREGGILTAALLGGEPTLHPKFDEILELACRNFLRVYIATNGIFSDKTEQILLQNSSRIFLFFNISTSGFIANKKNRNHILRRIKRLYRATKVVLVIISKFLDESESAKILDLVNKELLKHLTVRLVVEGTVAGDKNYTTVKEFPRIGRNLFRIYRYLEKYISSDSIQISKSVVPCMFTEKERRYLKLRGYLRIMHCHPETGVKSFIITPSLSTFKCYPLSTRERVMVTRETDFKQLNDYYQSLQYKYHKKYILPQCIKCSFFGLAEGKCPGPCLGFKINAKKDHIIL